jgi:GNAT superfamily N-acetyltransferase
VEVSRVERGELDAAAALLARAFAQQPLMSFLLGPGRRRERRLIFGAVCRDAWRAGCVEAVRHEGALAAVAVWLPPGAHPVPPRREARMLPAWLAVATLHPRAVPRLLRVPPVLDTLHPREPHWFLSLLGTEPAMWGRGLGAALVEHGLARARRAGVPVHLDTDSARNVAWYRRFGFEVTGEVRVMPEAPESWGMQAGG